MDLQVRIRELKKYFRDAKRWPLSRKGQNFLVDPAAFEALLEEGDPGEEDLVLEIGTGSGMLTCLLAPRAGKVITVEMDPFLYGFAEGFIRSFGNVEPILGDILETKNRLNPSILERVHKECRKARSLRIISNPPYNISTSLLINLMTSDLPYERIVFTLQLEIGMKVMSTQGTKDYGILSVISRIFSVPRIVKNVSAGCFWPSPKIESLIMRFDPREGLRDKIRDFSLFSAMLRTLFSQRRKTVSNALKAFLRDSEAHLNSKRLLHQLNMEGRRGEELSPIEIINLANSISPQGRGGLGVEGV